MAKTLTVMNYAAIDYAAMEKSVYESTNSFSYKPLSQFYQVEAQPTFKDDFLEVHPPPILPPQPPVWHISAQWIYNHRTIPRYKIEYKIWQEAHQHHVVSDGNKYIPYANMKVKIPSIVNATTYMTEV